MNCTCVKELENKFIGVEFGNKGKKIQKAKIPVALLFGKDTLIAVTGTEVELTVEGYVRNQKETLLHSFCPFCGTKITKE